MINIILLLVYTLIIINGTVIVCKKYYETKTMKKDMQNMWYK